MQKILLVEDDNLTAILESTILKKNNYDVVLAGSGEKATEIAISDKSIDMILMDIDLGQGLNGPDAAIEILKIRYLPIVFLTLHAEKEMVEKVKSISRYGYVLKNSGEFVLISSIQMAFELYNVNQKNKTVNLRLQRAETLAHFGNWEFNLTNKHVYASEGARLIYGIDDSEFTIPLIQQVPLPEYRELLDTSLYNLVHKNIPYKLEFKIKRPIDDEIVDIFSIAEYDSEKNIVFGIIQDITDRKKSDDYITDKKLELENNTAEVERSRESLSKWERRFQKIAMKGEEVVSIYNENTTRIFVTDNVLKIYGYTPAEYLKLLPADLIYPEDVDPIVNRFSELAKRPGESINLETRIKHKDGHWLWVDMTMTNMLEDEDVRGIVSNSRDISRRKKIELDLIENQLKLRAILEAIPDLIFIHDRDGRYLEFYGSDKANLLYKPEFFIGKKIDEVIPKELAEMFISYLNITFSTGVCQYYQYQLVIDGTIKYFDCKMALFGSDKMIAYIRDITENKHVEDALKRSEQRYRSFFENNHAVMLMIDPASGRIIDANPAAEMFYGWSRSILKEMHISQINTLSPEEINVEMTRAIQEERRHFFFRHRLADESIRDVEVYSGPIEIGGVLYLYSIVHDVTKRKEAENQVVKLLKEKETLLREVHHRIKNNMLTIMSLLVLQEDSIDNREAKDALHDAYSRVQSMMVIYDKLYRSTDFQSISVSDYLYSLISGISATFPASRHIHIEPEIGDFSLDSKILFPIGIIINELITNAYKYAFPDNKAGLINIIFKRTSENNYTLSIQDNGIGLPDDVTFEGSKSFGLNLVNIMVHQINGEIKIIRSSGTIIEINFYV